MIERVAKVFNGIYTVKSAKTGDHRTFKIHTQPKDAKFAPGQRIVGLLTGPDNTADYAGFAFIDDNGIHVWRSKTESLWKTYADMLWSLALDGGLSPWADKGFTILASGTCMRCNRTLTPPESILSGIGPVCAGR